ADLACITVHSIPPKRHDLTTSPSRTVSKSSDVVDRVGELRDEFFEVRMFEESLSSIILAQHGDIGHLAENSLFSSKVERLLESTGLPIHSRSCLFCLEPFCHIPFDVGCSDVDSLVEHKELWKRLEMRFQTFDRFGSSRFQVRH